MSDNELLELAARAYGIKLDYRQSTDAYYYENAFTGREQWYPLADITQAIQLAVALGLMVDTVNYRVIEVDRYVLGHRDWVYNDNEDLSDEEAVCRAIVLAATKIGDKL